MLSEGCIDLQSVIQLGCDSSIESANNLLKRKLSLSMFISVLQVSYQSNGFAGHCDEQAV